MDKKRLRELAGIQNLMEADGVVVVTDKKAIEGLTNFKLNGQTPLYIVRDSDVNGLIISLKPISQEQITRAIKDHSHWR